jgi:hypothetical protein
MLQLLGIPLTPEAISFLESRLESLEEGYLEKERWRRARRRFGEILEFAETRFGDEGAKCCLVHLFLDALDHDLALAGARKAELRLCRKFECQTLPGDARLQMLLVVQKCFPMQVKVAEELAAVLKDKEGQIVALVSYWPVRQLPLIRRQ